MTAKQEHTPGPWYTKHGQISSLTSTHGCTIANCNATAKGISPAEVEANARLIAAAPSMLRALKIALNGGIDYDLTWDEVMDEVSRAIAKAEGR